MYNCCCNSNRSANTLFATGITLANNELVLTFNTVPQVDATGFFCFRFSQGLSLPTGYATLPIVATVITPGSATATTIPVWNKYGNVSTGGDLLLNSSGQLCTRTTYRAYTGSSTDGTTSTTTYHVLLSNAPRIMNHC